MKDIGISGSQWRVLCDQIFPSAKSVQAIAMALAYCRVRKLDIYKRPVHIVPMWSSAKGEMVETVWPGISELRTTAARTGEYAGIDEVIYGPEVTHTFKGKLDQWVTPEGGGKKVKKEVDVEKAITYPKWASVVVYRMVKGVRCAFNTKVFWLEAYATMGKSDIPNEMWESRPFGQLDKCVEAAALRKAFPEEIGNDYTAEEMHGKALPTDVASVEVPKATPPTPPRPAATPPRPASTQPKPNGAQPKPANDQRSELAGKQVEDANIDDEIPDFDPETGAVEGDVVESEPVAPSDMLTALDDELATASDEATVMEIWGVHDLPARLFQAPNGDEFISIAKAVRDRHLKRVRK
ncbi:recombinase [Mesorhizobium sp. L103C120A0]|nr:recombinase [Mesorhizobium sp. L103C120A0]